MKNPTSQPSSASYRSCIKVGLLLSVVSIAACSSLHAATPPAGTATSLNNIGKFNSSSGLLTSCVSVKDGAGKTTLDANGKPQIYNIVLALKPPELVFRLTSFTPFDSTAGKDCSGTFRNGVFNDKALINYPGWVMDGAVLNLNMDLIAGSSLEFRLRTDSASFGKVRNFTGNSTQFGADLGDFKLNSVREFGAGAIPPSIKFKLPQCSDPQGDENNVVLEQNGTVIATTTPGSEYTLATASLAAGEYTFKVYCSDEAAIRSISTAGGVVADSRNFASSGYAPGTVRVRVPAGGTTTTPTATLSFQIGIGTSANDEQLIRQTAEFARDFMQTTFGRTLQRNTTITTSTTAQGCNSGGAAAFTGVQNMTICVGNQGWTVHGNVTKQKILIHEMFHLLQFELRWLGGATAGPHWLVEGAAEYVGWLGIQLHGDVTLATARGCMLKEVTDYAAQQPPGVPNFSELETAQSFARPGPLYPQAMIGVDQLLSGSSVGALLSYGTALAAGTATDAAFETAFGTSRTAFYGQFPAYKAALAVPATYLCRL